MRDPAPVSSGVAEQAIFTWSKSNLGSGSGQGIGEVSHGLLEHVPWLYSLDLDLLRPLENGFSQEEGYPGWEGLVAVGALPAGELNVVFRALAKAGLDGAGRDRFLVHMLVGRSDELDLGSAAVDDNCWLDATRCPVNRLPRLRALKLADLTPHHAGHDCAELDAEAKALLDELIESPEGITRPETAVEGLTTLLLAAVPTALWGQIRVGWSVGKESPAATVGMAAGDGREAGPDRPKPERARLADCALHREVDAIWAGLPAVERSWGGFARAYARANDRRLSAYLGAERNGPPAEADLPAAPLGVRGRVLAEIATAVGESHWDETRMLGDGEALRVLGRLEGLSGVPGRALDQLTAGELHALFGSVESNNGFSRSLRYFEATGVGTEWLVNRWQSTSLAVFGFAALMRMSGNDAASSWAVPKARDLDELGKLVRHLRRIEGGSDQLAMLLAAGFAFNGHARNDFVDALLAAEASTQEIFEVVIPRAALPPRVEVEFMRENIDLLIDWLKVPASSVEAFKLGFGRRRFSLASLLLSPAKVPGIRFDSRDELDEEEHRR